MQSFQAPAWLPYRVRRVWDHARVVSSIRALDRTAPMPVASVATARAEIHMLLCKRDVEIGVLALKSLLRFADMAWAVSITDDGSVTPSQKQWIDEHVPGCRWLPRVANGREVDLLLRGRDRLAALYRGSYQPLRKLIHPIALGRCEKVLVLDPDTLFSRHPQQLAHWVADDAAPNLFLHDHQDETQAVPDAVKDAFAELREKLRPRGPWSMPYYFFNSGLLAFRRGDCDLDLAEGYLEWLETAPERYTTGKPGLWFGNWTPEQSAYQVIFAAMDPASMPFDDGYRIGRRDGFTFNHFLWLQLIMPSSLAMLRRVVDALPRR